MRLDSFLTKSLFEATSDLLADLSIKFDRQTAEPIELIDFFEDEISKQLDEALTTVDKAYYVGLVNDETIKGNKTEASLDDSVKKVNEGYNGLLIFGLDLHSNAHITRTILAALTRGLNRIAKSLPVVVIFRQGKRIALSTCERTAYVQQWRQGEKVGKVTILRDINCEKTHRGHIDILNMLECSACNSFDDVYAHWQEVFSSELLTKKFYRELQNWYFWAIKNVSFPNDIDDIFDDEKYNPQNTIRLITRMIFVWFIKHKHFIPDEIFDLNWLKKNLKDFDENSTGNQYYRAILQNLFFATLNQEIGKRSFASDSSIDPNTEEYRYLYLYENEFNISKEEILSLYRIAPFINGGLFECLDEKIQNSHRYYWDGFSEEPLRQAKVPNFLFFARNKTVDLSKEYDDKSMKNVPVSGLINIFSKYNFTVEENTPLDVDVALDPELLGKVFENLLASYNPETKTTARKQTGSFYTPREIVNYMVDESLVAYLKGKVPSVSEDDLRSIISYNFDDAPTTVSDAQRKEIISALFNCKILDPACGSGAFPMGILQQICHILAKLDNNNSIWEDVVLDQTINDIQNAEEDPKKLEEVKRVFKEAVDSPDYARKLYIIEHCIYGVDIQSIAVQISRLRFFISLICEQQSTRHDPSDNYDILPLPNLETKFVAANTLIPLEKDEETMSLFGRDAITKKIKKLEDIRHRSFSVTNNELKIQLRREDEQLREEVVALVKKLFIDNAEAKIKKLQDRLFVLVGEMEKATKLPDVWENVSVSKNIFGEDIIERRNKREEAVKKVSAEITKCNREITSFQNKARLNKVVRLAYLITGWNPYDQNASSPFFDPEWMFRVTDGFDIVIGNPPYISAPAQLKDENLSKQRKHIVDLKKFNSLYQKWDLYIPFMEFGMMNLNDMGVFSMIVPYPLTNQTYGKKLREIMLVDYSTFQIVDLNGTKVFENATVSNCIPFVRKSNPSGEVAIANINEDKTITIQFTKSYDDLVQDKKTGVWNLSHEIRSASRHSNLNILGDFCYISKGMVLNADEKTAKGEFSKADLISNYQDDIHSRAYIEAKCIVPYATKIIKYLEWNTKRCPGQLSRPTFRELYDKPKLIINCLGGLQVAYDDNERFLHNHSLYCAVLWNDLAGVNNKSISSSVKKFSRFSRKEMEELSSKIDLRYIIGILNSNYADILLTDLRGGDYHIYPEHMRNIPIPLVSFEEQEPICKLVDIVIDKLKEDLNANVSSYLKKIDELVYQIYNQE